MFQNMRLGKGPRKIDERTLFLSDYTKEHLQSAPMSCNLTPKISKLGMMGNDQLGDCTCAAVGHIIQQWTAENGKQVILSDDEVISLYVKVGGYIPGDPSTDNGAVCLDVLNYWRKNPISGNPLNGYVAINPTDGQEVTNSIYYFGNMYVGLNLPLTCQNQTEWHMTSAGTAGDGEPGSWGGHCVPIVAYAPDGLWCITWGQLLKMDWKFYRTYCDEAYALLSADWCGQSGKCPAGFDLATLQADLKKL